MCRTPVILVAILAALACPAGAIAAPVLVLGHHGGVTRREDPYLGARPTAPAPAAAPRHRALPAVRAPLAPDASAKPVKPVKPKKPKKPPVTVASVLTRMAQAGRITALQRQTTLAAFDAALATERHLSGTRRTELAAVTTTVHDIAARGALWPSRLAAVDATLDANRRWWTQGTLLSYGQRVEFAGSQLEWEYYPGQGIQLQVLGSFGKANGLWQAGPAQYPALQQLLAQIIPLASDRGGGLTWEYYFDFDGGAPPWTSAMSQATGLLALTHAYQATHNPAYLTLAARALSVLTKAPPTGVAVTTPRGLRFLQYSFSPATSIINAFLQTLIGLDGYAQVSHNPIAARLFAAGDAEAQSELPHFNTGAWSLYQPGEEDDLSYHELVTGFLGQLCTLTATPVYCTTAQAFTADLKTPPTLTDLTPRTRARRPFALRFSLSKISDVGVTIRRGSTVVFATSATFGHGVDHVSVAKLAPGGDTVTLTATDLAGNSTRTAPAPLTVTR